MTKEQIEQRAIGAYPKQDIDKNNSLQVLGASYTDAMREGYIEALTEIEDLPKVYGWLARDKNGKLNVFWMRPDRGNSVFNEWYPRDYIAFNLDTALFPNITWESEPIKVELLIR